MPDQPNEGRPVTLPVDILVQLFSQNTYLALMKRRPQGTFDIVDIYNPITNTWRHGPDMSTGQHGIHPVVYDGKCPGQRTWQPWQSLHVQCEYSCGAQRQRAFFVTPYGRGSCVSAVCMCLCLLQTKSLLLGEGCSLTAARVRRCNCTTHIKTAQYEYIIRSS